MAEDNTRTSATWCSKCGGVHPPAAPCSTSKGARAGTVLDGKYALVRLLGKGGMGEVYEARHTKIGRRAAVKFLHGQFAKRPEAVQRFENEARAAGEVEHENIAGVYDVGALPDGTQYLVMEFLDGEDLDRVLKRERRLSLVRAADLMTQACQGLDVVHRRGIVHRDLKPANLFIAKRANGTDLVKILDFGIAKLRHPEGGATVTETGVAIGTAYYMSPEQARGERDIGARSDVYALGVILYELLSGRRPHNGDSLLQILHHILTRSPTPLEEICPGLPDPVYRIVRKAMAANAADRFAGVGELAEALAPFVRGAYRPSQPAPLDATRMETAAGVRIGTELIPHASSPAQSVAGVASSSVPARRVRRTALAVSAVAMVAIGVEAFVWTHRRGGATAETLHSSAAAPSATVPPAAPPTAASLSAASAPPFGQEAPRQDGTTAQVDDGSSAPDAPKKQGRSGGPSLATHGNSPSAGRGMVHGVLASTSTVAPPDSATKPDCTKNYTVDSEGNKVFRPECFQTK